MISGLAICSLEAFKVSAPCRRTRRLPYKVDFFTFPREQNVNKSWVNKELTLVYGIFESSKIISSVNKQLTVYSNLHHRMQLQRLGRSWIWEPTSLRKNFDQAVNEFFFKIRPPIFFLRVHKFQPNKSISWVSILMKDIFFFFSLFF